MGPAGTPFTTGDVKLTYKTVADAGWVMMNDGSIGNVGSGATFANAAAQNLFSLFFGNCADADVPIQTSAGGATTRAAQGTASAAWTAGCRLVLPKALGRELAISGAGSGLTARALGSSAGAETQSQTVSQMASHTHNYCNGYSGGFYITNPNNPAWYGQGAPLVGGAVNFTIDYNGNGAGMSILSPRSHLNVMVCL
jgi:hypothetical protein